MAELWVKQKPNDSEAHLRLGRVRLLLSNSADGDKKQKYVDQAKGEFRRAIELTPNDVRPWAAIVMLYGESRGYPQRSSAVPRGTLQTGKDQRTRANVFVLAQLYDMLGISSQAQFYFNQAATLIEANPKADGATGFLAASRFYSSRVPALGEMYARWP